MSAARPKVAVVYNAPVLPADHPDARSENDVVAVARSSALARSASGFAAELLAAGPPLVHFISQLAESPPT